MRPTLAASFVLFLLFVLPVAGFAQTGSLRGRVVNAANNAPLAAASVTVVGSARGALTADDGTFEIAGIPVGQYPVAVALLGYRRRVLDEVTITNVKPVVLEIAMDEVPVATDSVTVTAAPFRRRAESPNSVQTLGEAEIARYPGGGRDLSQVLQSLPGVAAGISFRNDVIVRGGAPNENRFYLDDIEVPNINHFATQGSSGGPVGMINVDFIREVNLFSSAFPANRGNALSSVLDFRMKDGNDTRRVSTVTLGASDLGLTLDGPLGRRSNYIFSLRRSYLQFVFKALDLPFLPTYNDLQFRVRTRIDAHDEVSVIGLGAIDRFAFNTGAKGTELNRYLLDNLPSTPQWNYTLGGTWKRFDDHGVILLALSRNQLDNRSTKYAHNDASSPANLIQDYASRETENKARLEHTWQDRGTRVTAGLEGQLDEYTNATREKRVVPGAVAFVDYRSALRLARGGAFAQASRSLLRDRATASLGVRVDAADYSRALRDPLRQFSPRLALSYRLAPRITANASAGRYYQLPPYTTLGWRDGAGRLVNRDNGVGAIRADHLVAGVDVATATDARVSLEGFYKRYANYPFLLEQGISLANLGADFGVIGDAPAASTARGRSWGVEALLQQKLHRGWYGIAALTWARSEAAGPAGRWAPTAWDDRTTVSLTGGRKLPRNWEVGARWRYRGGAPYTPDDVAFSSRRDVWDASGRAFPDWSLLNSERTAAFHQLDVRVDRRWYLHGRSLDAYLDVQNIYAHKTSGPPILVVDRDPSTGDPLVNPADTSRYLVHTLANDLSNAFPTIGIVFQY
jgi:hypothetical protein